MLRLLNITIIFPPLFVALALSAIYAGTAMSAPSALSGLDDCSLPCWRGITPRGTLLELADGVLTSAGYERVQSSERYRVVVYRPPAGSGACNVGISYSGGTVITVTLSLCKDVRLGDLMAILDAPQGILRNGRALTFRDGTIIVSQLVQACADWFSPLNEVFVIYLTNPGPPVRRSLTDYNPTLARSAFDWRGFATRTYYQMLEPNFPGCE
jgi:hypothetical protein